MPSFVYVFNQADRDALLLMGYELLQSDIQKHMYVFANSERYDITYAKIQYVLSDTLTF